MVAPELVRGTTHGVTLLGDPNRPSGVTLAFTERTGGVSEGSYSSLNLGSACGDLADAVQENRRRVIAAVGATHCADALVEPRQVHGDHVVVVGDGATLGEARKEAREGADAVVCVLPCVPVLMCFADCVPVILVADGGFAVVHSGWKGTIRRIAAKALRVLVRATSCDPGRVNAYIGPHIGVDDYEVSTELAHRFIEEFGSDVVAKERHLDLGKAVSLALEEAGVVRRNMVMVDDSTASCTSRFFSYRAQQGTCGRHGAIAWLGSQE